MNKGFSSIAVLIIAALASVAGFVGYELGAPQPAEAPPTAVVEPDIQLGAFRPSGYVGKLLTRLNEGGAESTFNTTPGTTPDGQTLLTTHLGDFIVVTINPGASNEEKISASAVSVSGTTATWTIVSRGLSFASATSTVTANKKQHAIGERVIISNDDHFLYNQYPAKDQDETITGQWTFSTFPITPSSPAGSETTAGILELATGAEAAASTLSGSLGRLALSAVTATSTYNAATAPNKIPVTGLTGVLDNRFLGTTTVQLFATTTITGGLSITGTSTIASTTMLVFTASSTPTATWTKPANLKYIKVQVQGPGGNGGNTASSNGSAGGGGGAWCIKTIPAAALGATETYRVGGNNGGNPLSSTFGSFMTANGGANGGSTSIGAGAGGTCSGTHDYTVPGQGGADGDFVTGGMAGAGGDSFLGHGGPDTAPDTSTTARTGYAGSGYGGGGAGGAPATDGAPAANGGGAGTDGAVIIEEFYF